MTWQRLGTPPPGTLTPVRAQLHHAVQIPASVGYSFVRPEEDFGHTSLSWDPGTNALVSRSADGPEPFRCGFGVFEGTLILFGSSDRVLDRLPLDGRTVEDGYAWLSESVRRIFGWSGSELVRPDHELPPHPVGDGASFDLDDGAQRAELGRWFSNAHLVLTDLAGPFPGASAVRCWPHHFDIATLIALDPETTGEDGRSIGVGLSPGDGSYPEPYFYVTPWPYPDVDALSRLVGGGHWHTDGWVGAVLVARELTRRVSAEEQQAAAESFLSGAVDACRMVLGSP